MEEKNAEEFIEVDVESTEEIKDTKREEDVDPETKELEEVREEVLSFIKDANTDKLLEKYIALFRDFKESNKLKEEYLETAQLVQAEFENYKKRIYKDQECAVSSYFSLCQPVSSLTIRIPSPNSRK